MGADESTLRSAASLEMWLNENMDDEEFLEECKEEICGLAAEE